MIQRAAERGEMMWQCANCGRPVGLNALCACATETRPLSEGQKLEIENYIRILEQERADLGNRIDELEAEARRLSHGLLALAHPSDAPSGVLRSVAYDIAMNGMDYETAAYQIQRRTRLELEKTTESPSEQITDDMVIAAWKAYSTGPRDQLQAMRKALETVQQRGGAQ